MMLTRGRKLKDRIKIQQLNKVVQDFDTTPASWQDWFIGRANVKPVSSGEQIEGRRQTTYITHTVEIRHRPGVTTDMRILMDDLSLDEADRRVLHIDSVIDVDEKNRWLVLNCIEVEA